MRELGGAIQIVYGKGLVQARHEKSCDVTITVTAIIITTAVVRHLLQGGPGGFSPGLNGSSSSITNSIKAPWQGAGP